MIPTSRASKRKPSHNTFKNELQEKATVLNNVKVKIRATVIIMKKVMANTNIQRCKRDSRFFCMLKKVQFSKRGKIRLFLKETGYNGLALSFTNFGEPFPPLCKHASNKDHLNHL